MDKKEILDKIGNLEFASFLLDMKDHWTPNDFAKSSHLFNQILELKKEFKDEYGEKEYDLYFKGVRK